MNERLKGILDRIRDFWAKYNKRQKSIIIATAVIVVLMIALVVWISTRPKWEVLVHCNNYNQVQEVQGILTEGGIAYNMGSDALTVSVQKKDLVNAKILVGSKDIQVEGYSLSDALSGSFTTTESDKAKKYRKYLEDKLSKDLTSFDNVKKASVTIKEADNNSVLLSKNEDTSVAVVITPSGSIDDIDGNSMAAFLKTVVGNSSTEKINIISTTGATIFSGDESSDSKGIGSVASQQKYTDAISATMKNAIKATLLKLPMYDDAQISLSLDINYNEVEEIVRRYEAQAGREEGLFSKSYESTSTGTTGAGGIPGTASNSDDTTYYIDNGDSTTSEVVVKEYQYLPDEIVTTTNKRPGEIIKSSSTISVVLHDNVVYTYEDVKAAGLLDDKSWEEFKASIPEYEAIEVPADVVSIVANGTGLDSSNVSILAYRVPFFVDKQEKANNTAFWIRIALIAAIVLLLAFMVIRSLRLVTVEETVPELSVEDMLQTTKDKVTITGNSVDDIDLQDKSDVRKAIEKFVDENPEAVALLLRNWLEDEW